MIGTRDRLRKEVRRLMSEPDNAARLVVLLRDFVEAHPEDVEAVFWYGDALRTLGRCSEAAKLLIDSFRSAPAAHRWRIAAAIAMAVAPTNPEEGEIWFARSVDADSAPGWVWILRGANLAVLERFDAAIESYLTALHSSDVDTDEVFANVSRAYRAKGDYASALEYLHRAQRAGPSTDLSGVLRDLEEAETMLRMASGSH